MKKLRGILTIFLLTLAIILPVSATELFEKDLKYGTSNNVEVKRLQEYLKGEKMYTGPLSGNYYGLTQLAVKKLQKKYNLKQDGKFNSITRERLNKTLNLKLELDQKSKELEEAQQLAESIEALRQYEVMKAQQPQIITNEQNKILTPEEFAAKYPNAQPFPVLPTSPSNPTIQPQPTPEIVGKKAIVKIQGNTHTKINVWGWNIDETSYGKEDKTVNYYINQNYPFKSVMSISINYGNPRQDTINGTIEQMRLASETKDFSCVKSGNEFWQGPTQSTVDGDSYIEPIMDTQKLVDNYMGKDLRFAVQCTNSDGTTSADYFMLHITNEAK